MKLLFFVFFSAALPVHSQRAQDGADDLLSWNQFYRLQWHDFQGQPDGQSRGDAGTAVLIKAKPFMVKKEIHYDVVALFDRGKSWARDRSASLLAHEQLHFDIAELYARKIRKKIKELQEKGIRDIKTFNAAINVLLLESNDIDEQYDLETLHGALSAKQSRWSERIEEELAALNEYRKSRRIISPENK